jgi:transcriptional regulator with XRE-family HTH domain
MALFFDGSWFDGRLAAVGLSRANIAAALGLTVSELAEIWKDQRELSARDVAILAALLGSEPQEIATRAGISTPVPKTALSADIEVRLARIEEKLATLEKLVAEKLKPID